MAALMDTLNTTREKVTRRAKDLRFEFDLKRERTFDRIRTESLERLFTVSEAALRRCAELLERAARLRALKRLDPSAQNLIDRAEALAQAREALHRPDIENYDELNVSAVNDELAELSAYELERVREYEAEHKNRVTVLREIDRRLEELKIH